MPVGEDGHWHGLSPDAPEEAPVMYLVFTVAVQSYITGTIPQVGKTAERRGSVTCPQVQAGKRRGWIFTQGILTSEAMLCKPNSQGGENGFQATRR